MRLRPTLAIAAMFLAAACGGSSPTAAPVATPTSASATPTPVTAGATCGGSGGTAVEIADFAFGPASATTAVGGSVTWTNADGATHTVTFNDGPDCGRLNGDAMVSATFSAPGTYAYHCAIHSSMRGSVVVK